MRRDLAELLVGVGIDFGLGAQLNNLSRTQGEIGKGEVLADISSLAYEPDIFLALCILGWRTGILTI